ncbi:MAG: glycosyltransferase family 4 protein [Gaiellales bacterium]
MRQTERPRICIAYDCLFPWTVGGAERWLTGLARFVAAEGFDVTYLTRLQWDDDAPPEIDGVRVVAVSPRDELYREDGSRTLREPVRFGHGVLRHLRRHRRDYDLVHVHSFPYFGALGAGIALRGTGIPIVVDWVEIWTRDYWRRYAGFAAGETGWFMQRRAARIPQHALISSSLHERRLRELGVNGGISRVSGLYDGEIEPRPRPAGAPPTVVFAGRHIPEKNVLCIPGVIAEARRAVPELRAIVFGDGPDHDELRRRIAAMGLGDTIEVPGFVDKERIDIAIGEATCLLLPSEREGYGLVVVEAAAKGTPSVVVAGPDNAAVELVEDGRTGFVAPTTSPADLGDAIVSCVRSGEGLRASTSAWANERGDSLTIGGSMRRVLGVYRELLSARGGQRP